MQAWKSPAFGSSVTEPVLVIGPEDRFQRALAREIASLPLAVATAQNLAAAADSARPDEGVPCIALVPEEQIEAADFEESFADLRVRTNSPALVPIAYGRKPSEARRRELRQAGIDLALFGRFGRHALRFQINRALSPQRPQASRGELRAPKEWRTRTFASGRTKAVRCYTLSTRGAYLVTPRPWVVGSEIALELPLGRGRLLLAGRILYTNVDDKADARSLPRGMAVAFDPLSDHLTEALRQDLAASRQGLEV